MSQGNRNVGKTILLGAFLIVFLLMIVYMNEMLQREIDSVGELPPEKTPAVEKKVIKRAEVSNTPSDKALGSEEEPVKHETVKAASTKKTVRIYEQPINDPVLPQ